MGALRPPYLCSNFEARQWWPSLHPLFSPSLAPPHRVAPLLQSTLPPPADTQPHCCALPPPSPLLCQVSNASAAVSSFDDVCEAFGDIAKLDNLVARGAAAGPAAAAAAVLAPPGAPVGFDLSVALRWVRGEEGGGNVLVEGHWVNFQCS